MKLPGDSATNYAKGFLKAGNGTLKEACVRGCHYDGVPKFWWRLVAKRVKRDKNLDTTR
jgi:hypothetical protein